MTPTKMFASPFMPDTAPMLTLWTQHTKMVFAMQAQMVRLAMAPWDAMLPDTAAMMRLPAGSSGPEAGQEESAAETGQAATSQAVDAASEAPAADAAQATHETAKDTAPDAPMSAVTTPEVHRGTAARADTPPPAAPSVEPETAAETGGPKEADTVPQPAMRRPDMLDAPRGGVSDDLKRIKGVGPKLAGQLHAMGIHHFDQVAAWSPAEVAWMDENLDGLPGRVSRDNWVEQASLLAKTAAEK